MNSGNTAKRVYNVDRKINVKIFTGILMTLLLLASAASAVEQLKVSTSRYSIYAPWQKNSNYGSNLSGTFTAFALLLDNGSPVSGTNITFITWGRGVENTTVLVRWMNRTPFHYFV